jgi:predicted nucleic-acid-binding Zn-ribbon protein
MDEFIKCPDCGANATWEFDDGYDPLTDTGDDGYIIVKCTQCDFSDYGLYQEFFDE